MGMDKDRNEKLGELLEKLEAGILAVFEGEKFKEYLKCMAKFHDYSYSNVMLILAQKPDATLCAGYRKWEAMGRHVNRGEKAIRIIAPVRVKKTEEHGKTHEVGQERTEGEKETERTWGFRVAYVFDVSQTSGAELPDYRVGELSGNAYEPNELTDAIRIVAPVQIEFAAISGSAKGYYSMNEKKIVIREGMSDNQTIKTMIHETTHALLHDRETKCDIEGVDAQRKLTAGGREVEAEAVAYVVCQHFGIDTGDYSCAYLTGWSSGKELPELKESLDIICRTAGWVIDNMEEAMEIREDEGIGMLTI